jgi:hypothetical protein
MLDLFRGLCGLVPCVKKAIFDSEWISDVAWRASGDDFAAAPELFLIGRLFSFSASLS